MIQILFGIVWALIGMYSWRRFKVRFRVYADTGLELFGIIWWPVVLIYWWFFEMFMDE